MAGVVANSRVLKSDTAGSSAIITIVGLYTCHVCGAVSERSLCPAHRRRANRHSHPARGTAAYGRLRLAVLERDGYVCRWCGAAANEIDHLIPRALGGPDEEWNLVAACAPCNRRRGARAEPR
jgi:5-methylcytosine-specific restriction endonuclease McrA